MSERHRFYILHVIGAEYYLADYLKYLVKLNDAFLKTHAVGKSICTNLCIGEFKT
jgi:hypothetical protein